MVTEAHGPQRDVEECGSQRISSTRVIRRVMNSLTDLVSQTPREENSKTNSAASRGMRATDSAAEAAMPVFSPLRTLKFDFARWLAVRLHLLRRSATVSRHVCVRPHAERHRLYASLRYWR
jgi:hypothetical protein